MKEFFFQQRGLYYRMNDFRQSRPTLVFIHGLGGSSSAWFPYEKRFENQYNILTFDLRGHGKSVRLPRYEDYEIKKFVSDTHDLISYLHISNYVLISHSLGTLIALEYIELYQNEMAANIFLAPSFKVGDRIAEKIAHPFIGLSKIFDYLPFNDTKNGQVDYAKYPMAGDWNLPRMFADIKNTTPRVYFASTRQVYGFNRENILEKIYIPCLIIHGKKDTIFSVKNAMYMHKKIQNSDLVILSKADHVIPLNYVSEVCDAMTTFLEKNSLI